MSKIVYGKRTTDTVQCIDTAPMSIQRLWNVSNALGINIVRVRKTKNRNELTSGDTFLGYHKDKVSIYQQKSSPKKPLHFVRPTPLGKDNRGMQILEVADNIDVQDTLEVINDYEFYTAKGIRAWLRIAFNRVCA